MTSTRDTGFGAEGTARGSVPVTAETVRTPEHTRSVLTYRMGVGHANAVGDVHGGWIMKLCDDVAVIAAMRHAQKAVVTAAVDGMKFRDRVLVNDVLTLKATVNAAWRTSMEVGIRVEAEDVLEGTVRHTLTAYLTMVAVDDGRPIPVPPLEPRTDDEHRRWADANLRRTIRLAELAELRELHKLD